MLRSRSRGPSRACGSAAAQFEQLAVRGGKRGFEGGDLLAAAALLVGELDAAADYIAVVNKAEADLAEARERHAGRFDLVGRLWLQEWGWAERKEWLERMVRSVVVSRAASR